MNMNIGTIDGESGNIFHIITLMDGAPLCRLNTENWDSFTFSNVCVVETSYNGVSLCPTCKTITMSKKDDFPSHRAFKISDFCKDRDGFSLECETCSEEIIAWSIDNEPDISDLRERVAIHFFINHYPQFAIYMSKENNMPECIDYCCDGCTKTFAAGDITYYNSDNVKVFDDDLTAVIGFCKNCDPNNKENKVNIDIDPNTPVILDETNSISAEEFGIVLDVLFGTTVEMPKGLCEHCGEKLGEFNHKDGWCSKCLVELQRSITAFKLAAKPQPKKVVRIKHKFITCGACKNKHNTSAEVKACYDAKRA